MNVFSKKNSSGLNNRDGKNSEATEVESFVLGFIKTFFEAPSSFLGLAGRWFGADFCLFSGGNIGKAPLNFLPGSPSDWDFPNAQWLGLF